MILSSSEIEDTNINGQLYQGACVENIEAVIEKIVNEYDFIKTKSKGVICHEGSNFVRLLGQLIFEQENVEEETVV